MSSTSASAPVAGSKRPATDQRTTRRVRVRRNHTSIDEKFLALIPFVKHHTRVVCAFGKWGPVVHYSFDILNSLDDDGDWETILHGTPE